MYLGIDLGTSAVKVVVTDDRSEVLAQASSALDVSRPQPLWSEQAPEDWYQAMESALTELAAQHASVLAKITCIGLSGQMHGATLLDANHQVLRPTILWNDGRCARECLELEANVPETRQISGNIAMPGFTAPKLLWVRKHEPGIFDQIRHVLLPKDYLRLRLSGELASDMSDSAGTLWLNVEQRAWSDAMLAGCELGPEHMPRLYEGPEITGTLRADLARRWGMNQVPIVAGAGDNAAGAVGAGVVRPGDAFLSLGTSGVYFLANENYSPNPERAVHSFCHGLPNTWHQMSVSLSAASCLDWVVRLTGGQSVAELLAELEQTIGSRERLDKDVPVFLPYLSGERTPHNNPDAQGVFFGLTNGTERPHLVQSVLEGVAFAFADGQQALLDTGENIEHVSVIGGGSRSALWGKLLSAALDRPLHYHEGGEIGPALGAARLAQLGSEGDFSATAINDVCFKTPIKHSIEPEATLVQALAERWQLYRDIYQQTSALL